MLKSEFVEMGGKEAEYEKANEVYTSLNCWNDHHDFIKFWLMWGEALDSYNELETTYNAARRIKSAEYGLFTAREIMERYSKRRIARLKAEIERAEKAIAHYEAIQKTLEENENIYNF